jgi:hypothetical protein
LKTGETVSDIRECRVVRSAWKKPGEHFVVSADLSENEIAASKALDFRPVIGEHGHQRIQFDSLPDLVRFP